ncbi:conserved hypothetical protein [Gloeothece citriformis PCC 7424]|uniref:Uncharacterized protein n=1 Tax=Gloeothece citriformis (strain PCC 7424) TaxID=65393 RepID=B7KJN1_GLOC7|nr:hypothetical protein [Gloeothece citriformis]ACK69480.1 conserved hypothetical protein [Gloeothece citriformis PCC 7424]
MELSSDTFNEVVYYLNNHKESLRIKKLIFCICKKYWENDINILNSVTLNELVQELIKLKPSNDQLSFSIYKLVKTLNRSTVYDPLAKVIIEQISRLYHSQRRTNNHNNDNAETTQIITSAITSSSLNKNHELLFDKVVTHLANHREETRIKKLVFAVSKNRWENDINIIENYGLKNLILDLYQTHKTTDNLRESFNRIVQIINKKAVYSALSKIVINQIEILYDAPKTYQEETKIFETQIIHLDPPPINEPEKVSQLSPSNPKNRRNPQDFATSIIEPEQLQKLTQINVTKTAPVQASRKPYNSFEIRLEIMQYTNPLRAKILLYSLLVQPWDETGQDWGSLKLYSLDDLLNQLITSGKSLTEIETSLSEIAKKQPDVDSALQTANVIIQAIGHIVS